MSLANLVNGLADVVAKRYENGENYGVVIIPEGLIEFIPEVGSLISEINNLLGDNEEEFSALDGFAAQVNWLADKLSSEAEKVFVSLPEISRLSFLWTETLTEMFRYLELKQKNFLFR